MSSSGLIHVLLRIYSPTSGLIHVLFRINSREYVCVNDTNFGSNLLLFHKHHTDDHTRVAEIFVMRLFAP